MLPPCPPHQAWDRVLLRGSPQPPASDPRLRSGLALGSVLRHARRNRPCGARPACSARCSGAATRSSARRCATGAIVYDELDSSRRPAGRLDRRAGRRPLPARAPRRRGAVRLRRRAALVEAATCSRRACGSGGRAATPTASFESTRTTPRAAALRLHRRALLRPARDRRSRTASSSAARYVGPDYARPPRGRLHRRRQLRPGRRHLLLRLDGHRARARRRASTSR